MPEKFVKLHPWKFGFAAGILTAACVFLTVILGLIGLFPGYVSLMDNWLSSIYGSFGYSLSFLGAILGAIYSFIDCFIFVWLFALIYNKIL